MTVDPDVWDVIDASVSRSLFQPPPNSISAGMLAERNKISERRASMILRKLVQEGKMKRSLVKGETRPLYYYTKA